MASYWGADYEDVHKQMVAAARSRCTQDRRCPPRAFCRPHPRKKRTMDKVYKHKGEVLVPMTETIAMSLDKADVIKYIAGENRIRSGSERFYGVFKRRNYKLADKPTYLPGKKILRIKLNYYDNIDVPIDQVALVERGDPTLHYFNQAVRYLPMNLKGFKRDLRDAIARTKDKTDYYLERLPLHRKLELFRKLTPQEQVIYDFLYKDVDELMKPDDTPDA